MAEQSLLTQIELSKNSTFRAKKRKHALFPNENHVPGISQLIDWRRGVPTLQYAMLAGRCAKRFPTIRARSVIVDFREGQQGTRDPLSSSSATHQRHRPTRTHAIPRHNLNSLRVLSVSVSGPFCLSLRLCLSLLSVHLCLDLRETGELYLSMTLVLRK